jgi:hypothetical protein
MRLIASGLGGAFVKKFGFVLSGQVFGALESAAAAILMGQE